jgi:hypothetical protein
LAARAWSGIPQSLLSGFVGFFFFEAEVGNDDLTVEQIDSQSAETLSGRLTH